jgi:phosphoserine phosphatase RsbU/P
MSTLAGRVLIAGVAVKAIAFLIGFIPEPISLASDLVDTLGDICVLGGGAVVAYRLIRAWSERLLWRVRRKLILSYVFIGVVPALLIVTFFLLAGLLMFYNVSAYVMQSRMRTLQEQVRFLARTAALEMENAASPEAAARVLQRREVAASEQFPGVSFAVLPASGKCTTRPSSMRGSSGPWSHLPTPSAIPDWLPCEGYSGLLAYVVASPDETSPRQTRLAVRGVARGDRADAGQTVVVDVPIGPELAQRLREDSGIALGEITALTGNGSEVRPVEPANDSASGPAARMQLPAAGISVPSPPDGAAPRGLLDRPLEWVSLLDYTDWSNGQSSAVMVTIQMSIADLYGRISASPIERIGNVNFGQLLLLGLALVAASFFVIQVVALGMGFGLARSITGSVHELFTGTEKVRAGDFNHKIAIRSRDQLGELAQSFNSMTASMEDLLRQKAEKERLEQELRIARRIQMSLLPQGQLDVPGLIVVAHCEPAREVGGDYYDFVLHADGRVGVLIADVAGKGTSAALYMAELKGLILSLSQLHRSPRQLLMDANRLIAPHLDDRSFITMTYAVIDPQLRTLTYARAGHCPLIYRPGSEAADRTARVMAPGGLVLGLKLGDDEMFGRLLEEETLPLGSGDLLVLFTDGITEAMNAADDCFGESRLSALVEDHGDGPTDVLRERILREIQAFTGPVAQHDDMTMVLLKIE